jgi:hypothetical protein
MAFLKTHLVNELTNGVGGAHMPMTAHRFVLSLAASRARCGCE